MYISVIHGEAVEPCLLGSELPSYNRIEKNNFISKIYIEKWRHLQLQESKSVKITINY